LTVHQFQFVIQKGREEIKYLAVYPGGERVLSPGILDLSCI